ncbi:ATP-binding protein [Actinacidiphila guanduensis]|uniref:ATP-binding protein n=1 Tax=Actinacidiphila guanduensis TaxID=310781 RepID=UPI002AFE7C3A|nr:ATP-binding protein [Actinacidiphila guanduensis]
MPVRTGGAPPGTPWCCSKPFGRWGEVFGETVATVVLDRLVHHAEVHSLKGDSYRMRGLEGAVLVTARGGSASRLCG